MRQLKGGRRETSMKKSTLHINPDKTLSHIAPEIYGQFSEHLGRCIYDGIFVGESSDIPNTKGIRNDVVEALRSLNLPVLRWPGGCFADEYHWKDGIGPKENRRKIINTNWGGTVEDNSFGTHEFMELCEQIDCEPYIAINLGSGTVQEAADWVEYMTAEGASTLVELRKKNGREKPWKVKYIGIGNENWGGGGSMDADYYASEYKRYQQFCKEYSGNTLYKIACGPNADDYHWTSELMSRINHWHAKGISLHYYTLPSGNFDQKGSSTDFTEKEYYATISQTLRIEEIIKGHLRIMDQLDPDHNIDLVVDEWGAWYDVEPGTNPGFLYQQNTMRDAIIAALNLNIFNKHSDRISMANIAQVVNVLQAMILTEDAKIIKTPTYEVFYMFKEHQDATLVESSIDSLSTGCEDITVPALSESVSIEKAQENIGNIKKITISHANTSLSEGTEIEICLPNADQVTSDASISLRHEEVHAYNTFEEPENVKRTEITKIWNNNKQVLYLPACSVCRIKCSIQQV